MADFVAFQQGMQQIGDGGWPATVTFALSTKPCSGVGAHTETDTYAGGFGEITGTGYARQAQAEPASVGLGQKSFVQMTWTTVAATNWGNPRSVVALDAGTTKILCAWNIRSGGPQVVMAQANATLAITPTYVPTNPV